MVKLVFPAYITLNYQVIKILINHSPLMNWQKAICSFRRPDQKFDSMVFF